MEDWIECAVCTTCEGADALCESLLSAGVTGFLIDDPAGTRRFIEENESGWDYVEEELLKMPVSSEVTVKFYLSDNAAEREILANVKSELLRFSREDYGLDMGSLELSADKVTDDWSENWKKYYKPFEVGEKLVICPSWEEYVNEGGKIVLRLNPGHAFGTGLHHTTRFCLEFIQKYIKDGDKTLDLGCGSGILSAAMLLLGAGEVCAVDIDANAAETAVSNIALNDIEKDRLRAFAGNAAVSEELREKIGGGYDLVASNIVADVIAAYAPHTKNFIKDGGIYISSGVIKDKLDYVLGVLYENGFLLLETAVSEEWVGIVCTFSKEKARELTKTE
ncbi:ribosomal protein L11 methyltransferase [Clostridia bacterium]|nr:ribosomal protein L11 methyltransferase [Clostridia bacterium]